MKKFILNTCLFLFFTVIFYIILLFFWMGYAPEFLKPDGNYPIGGYGHLYSRISDIKKHKNTDILFLGSSHAYRGFDTRIFAENGYSSFNLGSNSQTPLQAEILLNKYLDILNPKIIIYEVYPYSLFNSDGVEAALDLIANDKKDFNSLKMALTINNIKVYNAIIYGFICDFFKLNDNFVEEKAKEKDTYISGGFVEKSMSFYKPGSFAKIEIGIIPYQAASFEKIIEKIKKKNIKLILVYAPITKVRYDSFENSVCIEKITEQYGDYYNFNQLMNLNDSLHFYDSHHLNQTGVKLFNEKVIEILNKHKYKELLRYSRSE
ncbi:MAG: hypothetical protein CSB55_07585 [Candidatus Cloacimonadota bacterium]|nr:MAG: hypothetical protein CSB55_07585 [Candidatus Cloacimonadota bacterium]